VLLRSSTTVSVMGAIAPWCEENCERGCEGVGDKDDALAARNGTLQVAQWQWEAAIMGEVEL